MLLQSLAVILSLLKAPTMLDSQLDPLFCCSSDSKDAPEHINEIEHVYWVSTLSFV